MDQRGDIGLSKKKSSFSEWFSEILSKAELADLRYNAKGFLVHRPWAVRSLKRMYALYEKELEQLGHQPVWFPAVIPEENFRLESSHVEGFMPEVFWVSPTKSASESEPRLALRPTSETAMYKMYALWIRSWRDLPLKIYQSCQVWRYETKATRPFIRGREFFWIETHNVFQDSKGAEQQVQEDMETTEKVMHQQFGIPFIFFRRPEWDKFPGAVHTYAADSLMPDGKVLQQPSTHLLGQNFAEPFGIRFRGQKGEEQVPHQTCYGPCIWRMFASVIGLHGDDKGLIFPFAIAPLQVIIIPIAAEKDKGVMKKSEEIKSLLEGAGLSAAIDSSDNMPGWKFNQWEMKGVPIRLEIGPRDLKEGSVVAVRRDTGEKTNVKEKDILSFVQKAGESLTRNLIKKADEFFQGKIQSASSMQDLGKKLKDGGFVKVSFCSDSSVGKPCAQKIKDELHADIRGCRADRTEKPAGSCIACGKKASVVVYAGRQY